MTVLRIGRVELRAMDLEKSADYYKNVIGLEETGRDDNHVYLKAWDEFDHHSVILTKSDSAGLVHLAFKVKEPSDLDIYEQKIEQFGIPVQRIPAGTRLAEGEALRFTIPTGQTMELYAEIERVGTAVGNLNPHPWPDNLRGIAPHRLDHMLLAGDDVEGSTKFFTEVLGFSQTEKVVSTDGKVLIGSFVSCTNTAHDLAFIKGPDAKMHHVGFFIDSWHDVLRAADILSRNAVPFDVTPTRHGITRGETIYFFDPSGNRNETYAGGYMAYADADPIVWTEDKIGEAIFYHRRELNDTFTTVFS